MPTRMLAGCVLKHSTDFDERQPLILDKRGQNYKFVLPKNRTICLSHGQDIFLACPTETLIQSEYLQPVCCIRWIALSCLFSVLLCTSKYVLFANINIGI